MAGKWTGAFSPFPDGSAAVAGFEWSPRTSKAYSEGRLGNVAKGHPAGSDADLAYEAGAANAADPAYQFETASIGGAPLFSPEAQAVIDKMTAPTTKERNAIAAFVDDMQADSMWTGFMDSFQCYLMDSQVNSLVDWVAAGPAINDGGVAWAANAGFTFSGSGSWINTGIIPASMPNLTQVDGRMFGRFSALATVSVSADLCGGTNSDGGGDVTRFRNNSGNLQGTWNKGFGVNGTDISAMDNKLMTVQYGSSGATINLYVAGLLDNSAAASADTHLDNLIAVNGSYDQSGTHVGGNSGLVAHLWGVSRYTGVNEVAFNANVEALVSALTV